MQRLRFNHVFTAQVCTQQTRDIHLMLFQCWHTVFDSGPTLKQHWVNVPCLLGSDLYTTLNPSSTRILSYKPWRTKGFFILKSRLSHFFIFFSYLSLGYHRTKMVDLALILSLTKWPLMLSKFVIFMICCGRHMVHCFFLSYGTPNSNS